MAKDWNPSLPSIPQVKHRAWGPNPVVPPAASVPGWSERKDAEAAGNASGAGPALINFVLAKLIGSASGNGVGAVVVSTILQAIGIGSSSQSASIKPLIAFVPPDGIGSATGSVKSVSAPYGNGSGSGPGVLNKALGISAAGNPSGAGPAVPKAIGLSGAGSGSAANPLATAAFATNGPTTTAFSTAGAYSYTIPWWCNKVDVILLGAGQGGGGSSGLVTGLGGNCGTWVTKTLVRGVDIPWTTTTITGTVPAAGAGGAGGGGAAPSAAAATASATGMTSLSAAGGAGGWTGNWNGLGPGNTTFNGQTYTGGATSANSAGNAPGGGGTGGTFNGGGFPGSRGRVWFYAYQ